MSEMKWKCFEGKIWQIKISRKFSDDDERNEVKRKVCVFMSEKKDFVTSYFAWLEPSKQKKIAEKLENITKKEDKDRKK